MNRLKFFLLAYPLLCAGCDPAATLRLRAQVSSPQDAKNFAIAELKEQKFEPRPQQQADANCSYLWRSQTESAYPRATWTTYVDVCASDSLVRIRISDYPRFTLSPQTVQLRDQIKKSINQQFAGVDVVAE